MRKLGFLFVLLVGVLFMTSSAYAAPFDVHLTYWRPHIKGLDECPISVIRYMESEDGFTLEETPLTLHPVPTGVPTRYFIISGSYPVSAKNKVTASYWFIQGESSFGSSDPMDYDALEFDFEGIRLYSRPDNIAYGSGNVGFSVLNIAFQHNLIDDTRFHADLLMGVSYAGFTRHTTYSLTLADKVRNVLYTDLYKDVSQSAKMFGATIGVEGTIAVFQGSIGGRVSLGLLMGSFNDKCKYTYTNTYSPRGLPIDTEPLKAYRAYETYRKTVPTVDAVIVLNYPLTASVSFEAGGKYHGFYLPNPLFHDAEAHDLVSDHKPGVISVSGITFGVRSSF